MIPPIKDKRVLTVPVSCGRCAECLKKKSREWKARLFEEIKHDNSGQFVTLTFSTESLRKLKPLADEKLKKKYEEPKRKGKEPGPYELDNEIAKIAVRRFLERWRKEFGKSCKHWLITELGDGRYEHLHLHGILFTGASKSDIARIWSYGTVWAGYDGKRTYVNEKTINYIIKYVTKQDQLHRYYKPIILTTPGIGKQYIKTLGAQANQFRDKKTSETYQTRQGRIIGLPQYYRRKLYSEDQLEQLWLDKLDKGIRYVDGQPFNILTPEGWELYLQALDLARKKYLALGYSGEFKWQESEYEAKRRDLLLERRLNSK